ncbi:MAG: hypothetical protein A2Y15_01790 [Clostridiales bacterium GWF2_36_10]|nr:MAG: hypothetical protein A2Y15_01790 [Clostridiales bacterium GWF2_36_10]
MLLAINIYLYFLLSSTLISPFGKIMFMLLPAQKLLKQFFFATLSVKHKLILTILNQRFIYWFIKVYIEKKKLSIVYKKIFFRR